MHRLGISSSRGAAEGNAGFSHGRARRSCALVRGDEQLARELFLSEPRKGRQERRTTRFMLIAMSVVSLLLAGAAPSVEMAQAQAGAMVGVDYLNIRSEPATWAEVLAVAGYGQWVDILDGPTGDGWYPVAFEGVTGWVFGQHLLFGGEVGTTRAETSDAATAPVVPTTDRRYSAWVNTDAVAIRTAPDANAPMVETRAWGDQVTVIGAEVAGYVPIEHWSGTGWVSAQYLRSDGPPGATRWIDVDRSSELVTLYEGDVQVLQVWAAMSWDQSEDGFYATANGTYYVTAKEDDLTWTEYGNAWIRYYVEFDPGRANGFHSYSLEADGRYAVRANAPTSGCIALDLWAAEVLYNFAPIGTRVEIHW